MTRSACVSVLSLSVLICVHCRSQGTYPNYQQQQAISSADNAEITSTETPVKFTRKSTTTNKTPAGTTNAWEAYIPTLSTEDQHHAAVVEGSSTTSSEYPNRKSTTADDFATSSTEGSSKPAQMVASPTSQQDPNKFSAVHAEQQNSAFSETVYREKICKNEPTCHMAKLAPEELTNLGTRNCMCDEDCRKYGDCCLDSPYYNATEQRLNYQSFHCSAPELVYMQTKCPEYYAVADIRKKCEISSQPLASSDTKLATPVTNALNKITYGNEFCAQCHNDYDYTSWNFTYYCSEDVFVNTLEIEMVQQKEVNESTAAASVNPVPVRDYLWEMNEAAKHVKYDPVSKTFRSAFNNRNYICSYYRYVSEDTRQQVRTCIPSIGECSSTADSMLVDKCLSYTGVVYERNVVYKNVDCALCNGNQRTNSLKGCNWKNWER